MNLGNQPLGEVRVINAIYQLGNIRVINATPHPIRFKMPDGSVEVVESDPEAVKLFAANPVEKVVEPDLQGATENFSSVTFVQTKFERTSGEINIPDDALVIGSIVSAQAYGFPVVSLVPVPGTERAAPGEKIYLSNKFNVSGIPKIETSGKTAHKHGS
mgnify:CR=1 FL=1